MSSSAVTASGLASRTASSSGVCPSTRSSTRSRATTRLSCRVQSFGDALQLSRMTSGTDGKGGGSALGVGMPAGGATASAAGFADVANPIGLGGAILTAEGGDDGAEASADSAGGGLTCARTVPRGISTVISATVSTCSSVDVESSCIETSPLCYLPTSLSFVDAVTTCVYRRTRCPTPSVPLREERDCVERKHPRDG